MDDEPTPAQKRLGIHPLRKGEIYTVSGRDVRPDGDALVVLVECPGFTTSGESRADYGYMPKRFRPIVEKSTDTGMAVLREILDRESFDEKTPEHHKAR